MTTRTYAVYTRQLADFPVWKTIATEGKIIDLVIADPEDLGLWQFLDHINHSGSSRTYPIEEVMVTAKEIGLLDFPLEAIPILCTETSTPNLWIGTESVWKDSDYFRPRILGRKLEWENTRYGDRIFGDRKFVFVKPREVG